MPVRSCLGCGAKRDKAGLVRFTAAEGRLVPDLSFDKKGGRPGRGAYLCKNRECFDAAFKKGGGVFSRILKAKADAGSPDEILRLMEKKGVFKGK